MLFDAHAALRKLRNEADTPAATAATAAKPSEPPRLQQVQRLQQPTMGLEMSSPRVDVQPTHHPAEHRHGTTDCGRPLTWTGRVVSLEEWRQLSEWDKHGSTGKKWNGLTRKWEAME